jgi:dolichyl-phosphate beta-glucosyltransferase
MGTSSSSLLPSASLTTWGIHLPTLDVTAVPRLVDGPLEAAVSSGSVRRVRPHVELEVVIPALNEEARLPQTLARTVDYLAQQHYSSAIVVVDNGSVDDTADVVRRAARSSAVPVHLVGCATPGKGSAVRRGFTTGLAEYVGFMDADLATPIETLDCVLPLLRNGVTAVIGSRNAHAAVRAVPQGALRSAGGEAFRAATRTVLPGIADSQCGFKFFSGPAVRRVLGDCRIDGFSFDVELLGRLQRVGHVVVEVPVVWTDVAGSTFSPLRHGVRSFADLVRIHRLLAGAGASLSAVLDLKQRRQPVTGMPLLAEAV